MGPWTGHEGVVVGYWVDGSLDDKHVGVRLLMQTRPDWHTRSFPHRSVCCFVGKEVQPPSDPTRRDAIHPPAPGVRGDAE